jgi:molybdopterin-synthase adenylyltransferase
LANQSSAVELRLPYDVGLELREILYRSREEKVVLARIGATALHNGYAILVNSIMRVPTTAHRKSSHGVSWAASFNVEAIDDAVSRRLGLLIVHAHPGQSPPWLSDIDIENGTILCGAFRTAIPKMFHGTVVFGVDGAVGGLIWPPGKTAPVRITHARWLSDPFKIVPPRQQRHYAAEEMFDRQKIMIGDEGQKLLSGSKIGVVGLGGGGSHVCQQLALLGVGGITLVDPDTVEEKNRNRIVGARPSDATNHVKKGEVMRRMTSELNPQVKVNIVTEKFPSDNSIRELKECDIVIGCVDTLHSRKELQSFAWRHLIPYVDIGLTILLADAGEEAKVRTPRRISGQVYDLIPGAACLWCAQFITQPKLKNEAEGRDPSYMQSPQRAQVVSLNGVLASQAVNEVLHLITGYAPRSMVPNALQYDGIQGTLSPVLLERKTDCSVCSNELGHGDPIW